MRDIYGPAQFSVVGSAIQSYITVLEMGKWAAGRVLERSSGVVARVCMRFTLIDRIVELQPGDRIVAIKGLSLAEEYLKDHFPRFPVMPGVLMLEAMYQASAWLIRSSEDFAHTMVVLKEARNVKYANFVEPGQVLTVTAQIHKHERHTTMLKTEGTVDGKIAVSARLILERFNLADRYPQRGESDAYTRRHLREMFELLFQPATSLEATY